jgi:hypothetical protein
MESLNQIINFNSSFFGIGGINEMKRYFIKISKKEGGSFFLNIDLSFFNKDVYSKKEIEVFEFFYIKSYKLIQKNKINFYPKKICINFGEYTMDINCNEEIIICEIPKVNYKRALIIETK